MDNTQQELVHDMSGSGKSKSSSGMWLVVVACILLGLGTGYLFQHKGGSGATSSTTGKDGITVQVGSVVGTQDTSTFKDSAEGIVAVGGIEGEGAYHLVRPGGESQYVYMTSSIVDLSQFVKRKVKVWGQTQKAEKAGWLMDIGRVEVLQ